LQGGEAFTVSAFLVQDCLPGLGLEDNSSVELRLGAAEPDRLGGRLLRAAPRALRSVAGFARCPHGWVPILHPLAAEFPDERHLIAPCLLEVRDRGLAVILPLVSFINVTLSASPFIAIQAVVVSGPSVVARSCVPHGGRVRACPASPADHWLEPIVIGATPRAVAP
jgi:hypothetical protein